MPEFIFEVAWLLSTLIASFGGVAAAFAVIYQLRAGRRQRMEELRWSKAKLAKELLDKIESSHRVSSAFRLLDWSGEEHEVEPDRFETITSAETRAALRIDNPHFEPKERFIRDSFDALFDAMTHLEHYIATDLILFEDVDFLFEYYVGRMSEHPQVFADFMQKYNFRLALQFVKRYSAWPMPKQGATAHEEKEVITCVESESSPRQDSQETDRVGEEEA